MCMWWWWWRWKKTVSTFINFANFSQKKNHLSWDRHRLHANIKFTIWTFITSTKNIINFFFHKNNKNCTFCDLNSFFVWPISTNLFYCRSFSTYLSLLSLYLYISFSYNTITSGVCGKFYNDSTRGLKLVLSIFVFSLCTFL